VIGPHVSLGEGAVVKGSIIKDSIIGPGSKITACNLETSLIGHDVTISGLAGSFNLGDDSLAHR